MSDPFQSIRQTFVMQACSKAIFMRCSHVPVNKTYKISAKLIPNTCQWLCQTKTGRKCRFGRSFIFLVSNTTAAASAQRRREKERVVKRSEQEKISHYTIWMKLIRLWIFPNIVEDYATLSESMGGIRSQKGRRRRKEGKNTFNTCPIGTWRSIRSFISALIVLCSRPNINRICDWN